MVLGSAQPATEMSKCGTMFIPNIKKYRALSNFVTSMFCSDRLYTKPFIIIIIGIQP
jgi:hypothetical protein